MGSWRTWGALVLGVTAVHAAPALGQVSEIFKCTDASGRSLYTSEKRDTVGKKCQVVSRENVNVAPAGPRGNFPRESAKDSATARQRQREILQQELVTEQEALARAKQQLAEQEAVRSGDERNYAKVLERLQPFRDSVENHEKNIAALRRELANLR